MILSKVFQWVCLDFELGFLIAITLIIVNFLLILGKFFWWIINYSHNLCWCWLGGARLQCLVVVLGLVVGWLFSSSFFLFYCWVVVDVGDATGLL